MPDSALASPWKDLWNGDLAVTGKIIAEDFPAHAAAVTGAGPDEIHGRHALNAWVSGIHAILPNLTLVIDVGPITDEEHLVVRWKAEGTYAGGFRSGPRCRRPPRHLHRHRHPAHRRRQARRILGQRRKPAVLPATRRPRGTCPNVTCGPRLTVTFSPSRPPAPAPPGFPRATAPADMLVAFPGSDVLGMLGGRLAEYWVHSRMHVFPAQLQGTGG